MTIPYGLCLQSPATQHQLGKHLTQAEEMPLTTACSKSSLGHPLCWHLSWTAQPIKSVARHTLSFLTASSFLLICCVVSTFPLNFYHSGDLPNKRRHDELSLACVPWVYWLTTLRPEPACLSLRYVLMMMHFTTACSCCECIQL